MTFISFVPCCTSGLMKMAHNIESQMQTSEVGIQCCWKKACNASHLNLMVYYYRINQKRCHFLRVLSNQTYFYNLVGH